MFSDIFPARTDGYQRSQIVIVGNSITESDYRIRQNDVSSYPVNDRELMIESLKLITAAFSEMTHVLQQRHGSDGR